MFIAAPVHAFLSHFGLQNGDSTLLKLAILTSLTAKNIYFYYSL